MKKHFHLPPYNPKKPLLRCNDNVHSGFLLFEFMLVMRGINLIILKNFVDLDS